jgi:hypothetical protein
MTTWTSFLANIRTYLKDDGTTSKYSDQLILLFTQDALREYSQYFPRERRVEIDPSESLYALPDDLIEIQAVECPEGTYLKRRVARPGYKFRTLSSPTLYWQVGESLRLNADTDDAIFLTYGGQHPNPTSDLLEEVEEGEDPVAYTFTVPDKDMELINLYVRAQCLEQTRSRQANLDRFRRRGERDDNPMIYETRTLMDEFYNKIAQRSGGDVIYLYGI